MTNHPISLRSPAALLIVVVRATGSSFRGRCFPSCSLFLASGAERGAPVSPCLS
jgi:hypothetical protein